MDHPRSIILNDVRVQAMRHPVVAPPPIGYGGGIVLDRQEQLPFRHHRNGEAVDRLVADADYSQSVQGRYVYGGIIYRHFGHTMAEMIHRILPSREVSGDRKWLFVTALDDPMTTFADLPAWLRNVYAFLDVGDHNSLILNRDSIVDDLLVVEQGSDLGSGPKHWYLDLLGSYSAPRLNDRLGPAGRASKVYVARGSESLSGSILGEAYLSEILAREGFETVRPEQLPFDEQMDIYRKADMLLFPEGSACHGTELLGREGMKTCVLIPRRSDHLHIFRKVLEPRCERLLTMPRNIFLGSMLWHPVKDFAFHHLGVTLLDTAKTVACFRELGIAQLPTFSRDEYLASARADLISYIAAPPLPATRLAPVHGVQSLCARFLAEAQRPTELA